MSIEQFGLHKEKFFQPFGEKCNGCPLVEIASEVNAKSNYSRLVMTCNIQDIVEEGLAVAEIKTTVVDPHYPHENNVVVGECQALRYE